MQFDIVNFQTPPKCCEYMTDLLGDDIKTILEPTPGAGNLVRALEAARHTVIAPEGDFMEYVPDRKFDAVVANFPWTPMTVAYKMMYRSLDMADELVLLMPWLTLINSEKRTKDLMDFGLYSITHLPRNIFKGARVQTCILHLKRGYTKPTYFLDYTRK